jgi:type I restriction enzyme S subunit
MTAWALVPLDGVLVQHKEYIDAPEARLYPKLSVKLYGKGVRLDAPADGTDLKMQRHQLAKTGQVILSEIWGKKGAIGFVPPEGDGALCTSHFFLFDVRKDRIDPRWLQAIFTANYLENQLDSEAKGTTGYAAVRPAHLLKATIPLPPLAEQSRMVEHIEIVSEKLGDAGRLARESNEISKSLVPSFTQATFRERDWAMETVEQLIGRANLKNGLSLKSDGLESDIRCLKLSAMRNGRIDCSDSKPIALGEKQATPYLVHRSDVFIVRGNGSKELVGQAGKVEKHLRGTIFPDLFIRVPLNPEHMLPGFFVAWWNSPMMRDKIETVAKTTSGIWKINQGHIASFPVPVPPIGDQLAALRDIERQASRADELSRLQAASRTELQAVKPSLLNLAFSGQL